MVKKEIKYNSVLTENRQKKSQIEWSQQSPGKTEGFKNQIDKKDEDQSVCLSGKIMVP